MRPLDNEKKRQKLVSYTIQFEVLLIFVSFLAFKSLAVDTSDFVSERCKNYQGFLTNRPNIDRITFFYSSELTTNLLKKFAPELKIQPGQEKNKTGDTIVGSWQPSQYAITVHGSRTNVVASFGYNNGTYWQISGGVVTLYATNDTTYAPTLEASLESFLDVLNLGIPSVKYGTMTWNGLNFSASTRNGGAATGSLTLKDGVPYKLFCELSSYEWSYLVTYYYADENKALPDRYSIAIKKNGDSNYDEVTSISIPDLVTTTNKLENGKTVLYETPQYTNKPVWLLISNGQTIATSPSGHLIKIMSVNYAQQSWARKIILTVMISTSAIMLVALLRTMKNKHNKETQ